MRVQPQVQAPPARLVDEFLLPMRKLLGAWKVIDRATGGDVQITSWYRPPTYNASVGGQPFSQHTVGCAMDGISPKLGKEKLLALANRVAPRLGLTVIGSEGRAVHIQALPAGYVRSWAARNRSVYESASTFVGPPRPLA